MSCHTAHLQYPPEIGSVTRLSGDGPMTVARQPFGSTRLVHSKGKPRLQQPPVAVRGVGTAGLRAEVESPRGRLRRPCETAAVPPGAKADSDHQPFPSPFRRQRLIDRM